MLVYPTHVGMNRNQPGQHLSGIRIPHARGDEPYKETETKLFLSVYPTHVGMNRTVAVGLAPGKGIPHARGDEP